MTSRGKRKPRYGFDEIVMPRRLPRTGTRRQADNAVTGAHLVLDLDRAAHRVDDAGELDEEAVAGRFDDATPMLGDFGIGEFPADRTQRSERALLVLAHQPRIAGDIDRQNGRQSSLDPRFAHLARQSTGGDLRLRI